MKKLLLLLAVMLTLAGCSAPLEILQEEETGTLTLLTASDFGEHEYASGVYRKRINEFAQEKGVRLSDHSTLTGDDYVDQLLQSFVAGDEPDVFYLPDAELAQSMIDQNQVVSVQEICTLYPQYAAGIQSWLMEALADENGKNWYVPVSGSYTALFCNKRLFEDCQVKLPTTWGRFKDAIQNFSKNGITPIAAAFTDRSGLWVDHCIMACAADEHLLFLNQQERIPSLWNTGLIQISYLMGQNAFQKNAATTSHSAARKLFLDGNAAMILEDGSFINQLENPEDYALLPMPTGRSFGDNTTRLIVSVNGGYFISRKAWMSKALQSSAVDFVMNMSSTQRVLEINGDGASWPTVLTDQVSRSLCTSDLAYDAVKLAMSAQPRLSMATRMNRASWTALNAAVPEMLMGNLEAGDILAELWKMNQP